MTTIEISLADALDFLQDDDKTIELHASGPGIEIRIPFVCTLDSAESAAPPVLGPADDTPGGHVCPHCKKGYASAQGLAVHIGRTHNGGRDALPAAPYKAPAAEHVCDDCGLSFKSGAGLGGHRRVHRTPGTETVEEQPPAEVTSIERGRECIEPGCTTRLSAYNKKDKCGVHDSLIVPPKFARAADA